MRFLLFFLFFRSLFAMSGQEIDAFIAKNSNHFELLGGEPQRVYASNPPLLHMLYALAPEKITGLIFEWNKFERPYIIESARNQPIVGGFFGQGNIPNIEMLLSLDPELILINSSSKGLAKMKNILGPVKKPTLYLGSSYLEDYIPSLQVLGHVLNKKERANELVQYVKKSLTLSNQLKTHIEKRKLKRPVIYYAQGSDGLQTECDSSPHVLLIGYSGGEAPYKCSKESGEYGRVSVNFEQVLNFDPDIIIIHEREFYEKIYKDPKWSLLKAVQQKRAYLIPREPFGWFDRPPSFMRFLGLRWLINIAYPEVFHINIEKEAMDFYELFLGIRPTSSTIKRIINGEPPLAPLHKGN